MLWILFIAATLLWGVAYAVGYGKGQSDLQRKWKILLHLAKERRESGHFWN